MLNKINTLGAWTLTLALTYGEISGVYPTRWTFIVLPVLLLNAWYLLGTIVTGTRRLKHG